MPRRPVKNRSRGLAAFVVIAVAVVSGWRLIDGSRADPQGLAVFDRPQTASERSAAPGVLHLTNRLATGTARPGDVRFLGGSGDNTAYLVGFRRRGPQGDGVSGNQRFEQWCLVYGGAMAFQQCGDRRELLRGAIGGAGSSEMTDPADHSPRKPPAQHFYGVVPNAVKRVEQTFSGTVRAASGPVKDNFYDVISRHPEAMNRNGDVRWFDADGRLVKH